MTADQYVNSIVEKHRLPDTLDTHLFMLCHRLRRLFLAGPVSAFAKQSFRDHGQKEQQLTSQRI